MPRMCFWGLAEKFFWTVCSSNTVPLEGSTPRVPTNAAPRRPVFAWRRVLPCPVGSLSHGPLAQQLVCVICAALHVRNASVGVSWSVTAKQLLVSIFIHNSTNRLRCPGVHQLLHTTTVPMHDATSKIKKGQLTLCKQIQPLPLPDSGQLQAVLT